VPATHHLLNARTVRTYSSSAWKAAPVLERLGRYCARHPWWVLAGWAALAAAVLICVRVEGRVVSDEVSLPGSDSQAARDLLAADFPGRSGSSPLVLRVPDGSLTEPGRRAAVDAAIGSVSAAPHVTSVETPYPPAGRGAVSADGRTGYLTVALDVSGREITDRIASDVLAAARPATDAGIEVLPGGQLGEALSRPDTHRSELLGLVVAAGVLLLAFGTAVAMALPIVTAVCCLVIALAGIGLLGHVLEIPSVTPTLATMIGLGVGIDYALFCVTRHRALLAAGMPVADAAGRTVASAGRAVVVAGGSVLVALAGLALAGLPLLRAMGLASGLVVVVSVVAAVTLLPALLGLLGRRVESLALPRRRSADPPGSGWGRLAGRVTARPVWTLLLAGAALTALAAPTAALRLGQLDAGSDPRGEPSRQAYDTLAAAFGPGLNGPLLVVATVPSATGEPAVERVTAALAGVAGVASAGPARPSTDRGAVSWQVVPATAPSDPATAELVGRLRTRVLPDATAGTGIRAYVGGPTATKAELAARLSDRLPLVIAAVVAVSALVLLVAFRAPLIAAAGALLNLLSIGAAYGALTAVFEWGWGTRLLGLDGTVEVESYVPVLMFAVLFGLSMDYQVFLLSAVRDAYAAERDARKAVVAGLGRTGRIITSAALIMVAVFGSFVLARDPVVTMFGVGMAVAVAVDATVVRGLLMPAALTLLGDRGWAAPHRLPWRRRQDPPGTAPAAAAAASSGARR
jgi:putative drug exporter of the RND superfamily